MKLDCQYYLIPIIVYNDKFLSSTEKLLLSQIISLTLKEGYCYASNNYLANSLNTTIRTISKSLSQLKSQNYIIIKIENNNRKIYLNKEKIPTKTSIPIEENFYSSVENNFYHNKKELIYKNNKYIESIPEWMSNPKLTEKKELTEEDKIEAEYIKELLKEYS